MNDALAIASGLEPFLVGVLLGWLLLSVIRLRKRVRTLETAWPPRPGRCGDVPPSIQLPSGPSDPLLCELDHGHAGMHRDGITEWGKVTT